MITMLEKLRYSQYIKHRRGSGKNNIGQNTQKKLNRLYVDS